MEAEKTVEFRENFAREWAKNNLGSQMPMQRLVKVLHHRSPRVAGNQFSEYEPLFTRFK